MKTLLALGTVALATVAATAAAGSTGSTRPVVFVASSYGRIALLSGIGDALRTFGPGESPAFSADGRRIAFVRKGDVWVLGLDGSGLRQVTRTAAVEESPDWGPDGSIVYASNRDGHDGLYVQRPGGPARRLTLPPGRRQDDRTPAWSPDGRWIAFSSTRAGPFNAELYLVRPDGTGLRRLTHTAGSAAVPGDDSMPSWRPDGKGLVFVSNRDGNSELYGLELGTLRTHRLTFTPDRDETLPRVGPDGRFVFVVRLPGMTGSRLTIANAALGGRRVIQSGSAIDWNPVPR
jgi:Tol biopolymer transport system component